MKKNHINDVVEQWNAHKDKNADKYNHFISQFVSFFKS